MVKPKEGSRDIVKSLSEAPAIRGDLLSCYTASIAAYMERHQIDSELVLGAQLFLALKAEQAGAPKLSFIHYHTPLLGTTPIHALQLIRQEAVNPDEAIHRIIAEWKQSRAVIVVGDAMNLPWLVTCGRRHAPHWFLISDIDEQAGQMQIIDQFEFTDAAGIQQPFVGRVDLCLLGTLARGSPIQNHVFQARDQWAFGLRETNVVSDAPYQWFEQRMARRVEPIGEPVLWNLLQNTYLYHTAQRAWPNRPGPEWYTGLAAIEFLAQYVEHHLADPALYDISDDLWVAARNRQMFMCVLRRLAAELHATALESLAAWGEDTLVAQWHAIPRIMHYNLGSLKRGRRPTALLAQTLAAVAEHEAELMERLGQMIRA
jgi:hypothetical protein